jgi:hypothetical protein
MSMTTPTIQLNSRGLRNAPVKKTRAMCTAIEAKKMSAAQWWAWRIRSPDLTSKDRPTLEA